LAIYVKILTFCSGGLSAGCRSDLSGSPKVIGNGHCCAVFQIHVFEILI